jgi:hypothetical protein
MSSPHHYRQQQWGSHLLSCPRHHMARIMDPQPRPHVHTGQSAQRGNFNFLPKLFFIYYKAAHVFKIGILLFQVDTLVKRQ